MPLRYLMGRAHSNLQETLFQEISRRERENPEGRFFLIVPEQFTLQTERALIESQELRGILNVEVLSFTRLGYRVFNEVGGITSVVIDELGKNMMIKKILQEHREKLLMYEKISDQLGFAKKMGEMITELKRHRITPVELNQTIRELEEEGREDSPINYKLWDISMIYEKLNQTFEDRYLDSEDRMDQMIDYLPRASFMKGTEVWIHGFYQYTPQMESLIETLEKEADNITLTFVMEQNPREEERELFSVPEKALLKFRAIAKASGIQERFVYPKKEEAPEIPRALQHIEREFYAYPYEKFTEAPEGIELFAGANPYGEVEEMARRIMTLVREKNYRFRDIAIVSGDIQGYTMLIRRAFEEYGIPFFLDEKRSSMDRPVMEWILSALKTVESNYRYDQVFRFLKTGFHDLTLEEVESLENYALAYGVRGKSWKEDFRYGKEETLEELNHIRKRFIDPFLSLEKPLKGKKTVEEKTKSLFRFMDKQGLKEKLNHWLQQLKQQGHFESHSENTQVWNQTMEIFDQLVEILGEQKLSLKEYIKVLESGFEAGEVGVIPSTIDQVLVGNLERSRAQDIKAMFLIGGNDGVIPYTEEKEELFLDHERVLLKKKGLEMEEDGETKLFEQNYGIYLALTKPRNYLWFSYAVSDNEGRALRPSILVERFLSLFPKLEIRDERFDLEGDIEKVSTASGTFNELTDKMREYVEGKDIAPLWWDVYSFYLGKEDWQQRREAMIQGLFYQNQKESIDPALARELYETPVRASASRFEKFHNCPFAHFVSYGLRPRERKKYEVQTVDMGDLFHQSIDSFAKRSEEQKLDWKTMDPRQGEALVEAVIDELAPSFGNGVLTSSYRYQYLTRRLKRISKKTVKTLIEQVQQGDFEPYKHEFAFGEGMVDKLPFVIELSGGEKIYLEGRIDRLDRLVEDGESFIKVMDYKSGYAEFDLNALYHGLKIQLLLYLDAALSYESLGEGKPLRPAGVFYFKIEDPMVKDPGAEDPSEAEREAYEKAVEKEINKQLKMKGLALKDVEVLKKMDKNLEAGSEVLPVGIKKDGDFKKASSVASEEEFQGMIQYVRSLLRESGEDILRGKTRVSPCKVGDRTPCDYCEYGGICQFDLQLKDNQFRHLKDRKPEEVLGEIMKKTGIPSEDQSTDPGEKSRKIKGKEGKHHA
ncbi:helicase-exonuclease AddAB subunit AddB [Isachenkonia alkalipeptolytica]|uniref:Helicase-exonuclease AddAB subunit AddB n=1 Tax=Isachenkonia alkalipeptolytica TaxID=2565777 RepID=A0AA43XJ20_9CLOT|nr:helicase-exonuclease AddAB subunit AddB [Isachenkonia alkalipeptolytica]NBG87361.1 helicase-exonuclease AddAB subunit AddB [Isachenkonia alkalipeptolytica]